MCTDAVPRAHAVLAKDLLAGAVTSRDEAFLEKLGFTQRLFGGVLQSWDSYLLARGIKTLDVRMERINATALTLARFLDDHDAVEEVHYPGLPSHPDHALARAQMPGGFGGMLSFSVRGGVAAGTCLVNSLHLIRLAVSLGGCESLIEHPASMTHVMVPREQRLRAGITDGLVRFSPGLEHVEDLMTDLGQALTRIKDAT